MEVIKSAIVPVAGIGTRLLPATKSQPKEMLPVARKPIVQYVVEELVRNGIEQILFITGRNKSSIENHFDHDPELFRALTAANKTGAARGARLRGPEGAISSTRGSACRRVWATPSCAARISPASSRSWWRWAIPFSVCTPPRWPSRAWPRSSKQAARSCVIAVEEVPREETSHYGIVQPENGVGDAFRIVEPDREAAARRTRRATWRSPAATCSRR